jgi:hypothetical protein
MGVYDALQLSSADRVTLGTPTRSSRLFGRLNSWLPLTPLTCTFGRNRIQTRNLYESSRSAQSASRPTFLGIPL